VPQGDWAIIGTDMFSYESYPKEVCETENLCREMAGSYSSKQRQIQPGGMPDRFECLPLRVACKRVEMKEDEFRAFVKAMDHG